MKKLHKDSSGFSVIEILIVLVVVAAIGLGGYFVAKHYNKKNTPTTSSSTLAKSSNVWKNYCDSVAKLCLKYPSNWSITDQSLTTVGTIQIIENPTATANATYANLLATSGNPPTEDTSDPLSSSAPSTNTSIDVSHPINFYVSSISNLTNGDTSYKVVGGYTMGSTNNIPSYFVVNTSTISSLALSVGQISKVQLPFNVIDSNQAGHLILVGIGPITSKLYTPAQAAAWFNSSDGKTSLQIMQSFYTK